MKKIFVSLLMIIMLLGLCQSALSYTGGICTYDFQLDNSAYSLNVECNSKEINMFTDSEIEYGLTVPFTALSMDIEYISKENFVLEVLVDGLTYDVPIESAENKVNVTFRGVVEYEDHIFKIKASKPIVITKISLNKENINLHSRLSVRPTVDYTEDETALEDAVVFSESSNVIIVNNARRYIDYNDVTVKPQYFGGKLYLPLHTFARAFGAYVEESAENNYYFLRDINGTIEFCYKNGKLQKKTDGISDVQENVSVLKDNVFWVSVRYFAEELGEYVDYKDGVVVIDHKYAGRDIISNDKLMNKLKKELIKIDIVTAKEYHVSKNNNASDFNDGSYQRPFATIAKACKVAQPGDTVIVHEGVWREIVRPENDGTVSNPITIKAADGENVVLSANEPVTKFSAYGNDGMLIASVNYDLGKGKNMIFYNDEALAEARYPNYDDLPMYPDAEHYTNLDLSPLWPTYGNIKVLPGKATGHFTRSTATAVSDTLLTEPDDYWKGGVLVSAHGYNWSLCSAEIKSSGKGLLNLHNTSKIFYYVNEDHNDCGYITCTKNAIDIPGEWYMEDHKLYILPPEGETAETLKLEVKQRQIVADLSDKKHIIMKGFKTIGGSLKLNDAEMCILNEMDIRYISHFTKFQDMKDAYVDSGDPSKPGEPQRGEVGIYIGGRDNAVINSKLNYSAGAGLYVTGRHIYIENNYINECGYMGLYPAGISVHVEPWKGITYPRGGHTIVSNTIKATGRGCISLNTYEPWELNDKSSTPHIASEIAYNDLSDAMINTKDGGMVYTYMCTMGNDKIKSKWHHNILYNAVSADSENAMGLYADNCTEMLEIFNNVGFYEDPTYHYNNNSSVYVQYDAYVQAYNNKTLNYFPEGKDGLSLEHYPNYQVFTAGCEDMKTTLMANYELFDAPRAGSVIFAKDCETSEGAFVNSGKVYFTGDNQWIKFENVKLPANGRIKVNYSGQIWQKDNKYDKIEFVVGDDINNGRVITREGAGTIKPDGNKWFRYYPVSTDNPEQYVTLYLRVNEFASLAVESIEIEELSIEEEFAAKVYGGYYKEAIPANSDDPTSAADYSLYTDTDNYAVDRTWSGTIIHYEDVKLTDDGVKFVFNSGTQEPWRGRFEVRLNSLDSEPILTTMVTGSSFNAYQSKIVDLKEPVKAGTYDVYLTFIDENASCNLAWFGFLKEDYNTISRTFSDAHLTSDKVFGGNFDTQFSTDTVISKVDFDLSGTYMPGLSNVKGNEIVCYKNVKLDSSSKKIDLCWASDAGSKGTVKICVDSPESEPIGTLALNGKTMGSHNVSTVNLLRSIDEGMHDVYLIFEGTAEYNADVYWFAFSNL